MLTTRVIPTSGSAMVGGVDVVAHPTLAKQLLGVVSQQNTLDRQLTCWENLYFHGRLFGMPPRECRETADELLERFHLAKWAKASVYALSGGMAQRLMVARSIFHRPAVLFMDEPTAGLDPQGRLALWEILGELNRDGQTILLTTHYMEEADHLCDRVAIMDHGRILALDTPAGLKATVGSGHHRDGPGGRRARRVWPSALEQRGGRHHPGAAGRSGRRAARQGHHGRAAAGDRGRRAGRLSAGRHLGDRADPGDRVHQPDREGPARLMATTTTTGPIGRGRPPGASARIGEPRRCARPRRPAGPPSTPCSCGI